MSEESDAHPDSAEGALPRFPSAGAKPEAGTWSVGDIANGHVLGPDNTWHPLPVSRQPNARTGVPRWAIWIGVAVIGVLMAVGAGDAEFEKAPVAGGCAALAGSDSVKKMSCADARAALRVTSVHKGAKDGDDACAQDAEATSFYSYSSEYMFVGVRNFVLCTRSEPPRLGECAHRESADSVVGKIRRVPCTSGDAQFRVTKVEHGVSPDAACIGDSLADQTYVFGKPGVLPDALCLASLG